jgi:hypothetical protein
MFPLALAGDEEHFIALQQQRHKNTWGASITPDNLYAHHHNQWEVFATTFPHQAFLLHQLKSMYDNLAVVLRIFSEKQKERAPADFYAPRYNDPFAVAEKEKGGLELASLDPFEYFQNEKVDYTQRNVFLELFVSLATDRKGSRRGAMWREIGRSVLENSYDVERAMLVEELTSKASAEALNAVTGPSTSHAAIWRVRLQIAVRESAMQKALARLKVLLEEDKKKTSKRSGDFEQSSRTRSPVRIIPRERRRERSYDRSPVRGRRVVIDDDDIPIREKRRSRSPSQSDEISIEIIEDGVVKW